MDKRELEFRGLRALEKFARGEECGPLLTVLEPGKWPEPGVGARRLAGQANAARGETVLWVLLGAAGAKAGAGRDWLGKVAGWFDGLPPHVETLEFPAEGFGRAWVVAVETDRSPFVVRTPEEVRRMTGGPGLEMPWAEEDGGLRTASRADLVRLLSPLRGLPGLEMTEGELTVFRNAHKGVMSRADFLWSLDATFCVMPKSSESIALPFRRCRGMVEGADGFRSEAAESALSVDKQGDSRTVVEAEGALLVNGLGYFYAFLSGSVQGSGPEAMAEMTVSFAVTPVGQERAVVTTSRLRPVRVDAESGAVGRWRLAV